MKNNNEANFSTPPIDREALLKYCRGREDFVEKMLMAFVKSQAGYLADLEAAFKSDNIADIRAVCHKIMGSTATIKADNLHALIMEIRQDAIDNNIALAKGKICRVKESFDEITKFVALPAEDD